MDREKYEVINDEGFGVEHSITKAKDSLSNGGSGDSNRRAPPEIRRYVQYVVQQGSCSVQCKVVEKCLFRTIT